MTDERLKSLLNERGPLTGHHLLEIARGEALPLWQALRQMPDVVFRQTGRRYLRLDIEVEGYARLSPSIRREFLTYTVIGMQHQMNDIERLAGNLEAETRQISNEKRELAAEVILALCDRLPDWAAIKERVCFLIAGDITYDMAHGVPRPESSTGKTVRGSDLDIIAIADDAVPNDALRKLDDAMFSKKHYLLTHPAYQEEMDYLVKNLSTVRSQLAFDTFKHMVASKILHEGQWLFGSQTVFDTVKNMVRESGVPDKIRRLEQDAQAKRDKAEAALLLADASCRGGPYCNLFYTREEGDEIY